MKWIKILYLRDDNQSLIFEQIREKRNDLWLKEIERQVRHIVEKIKHEGDRGLLALTHQFDKNNLEQSSMQVTQEEFNIAQTRINNEIFDMIKEAIERIKKFHRSQIEKSWFSHQEEGMILGQLVQPLKRVGIYVPGGTAEYPSSLIMGVVPAIIAGVQDIIVVTPLGLRPALSPYLLMTAHELGIKKIYKVGGAQAIAAMAFGTETIQPVDKIVGPGNIYVTMAKKQVFGQVDIDMLAGPSEILIWAEKGANSDYIIADLFSQAEHDREAKAVLVTTSKRLAERVSKGISEQIEQFPRKDIIKYSLNKNGYIIVATSKDLVLELINEFAPEHLELQVDDPWAYLGEIKNAGAIFIGSYSPESLGDYWAGPNHILPTMGSARKFSVLSVQDFLKRSSVIYCKKNRFLQDQEKIARFADLEELSAHAHAVRIRK